MVGCSWRPQPPADFIDDTTPMTNRMWKKSAATSCGAQQTQNPLMVLGGDHSNGFLPELAGEGHERISPQNDNDASIRTGSALRVLGGTLVMAGLTVGLGSAHAADPINPSRTADVAASTEPGAIGNVRLPQFGPRPDKVSAFLQPLEIRGPVGLELAVETADGWSPPQRLPARVGLIPGRSYRLRLSGLPGRPADELYPSVLVLAALVAPPGQRWRFPIELLIDPDDLDEAAAGSHVKRAVYVSHEPEAADVLASRWFDVRPGDDCLEVARTLGDPITLLTLGNRTPLASSSTRLHSLAGGNSCEEWPVLLPVGHQQAIVPPPICDGGDWFERARPEGRFDIAGLSAGDTVARYRPDADTPVTVATITSKTKLVVANCECVYSPRFGSVRQIVRLVEETLPLGPGGLTTDTSLANERSLQPVTAAGQQVAVRAARKARMGLAVEERSGPLGVDAAALPKESLGELRPAERAGELQPESAGRRERLAETVGLDVPIAWTRLTAANALLNERAATVVSAGQGTATLRVESPGRAELTLCKRAGSDAVRIGEELDFTIAFLNSGDVPLTDIVVIDVLPERLELIPSSPAASLPAEIDAEAATTGGLRLSWRLLEPLPVGAGGFVRFRTIVR